ncbi:hypothetical protein FH972_023577 [Carpinus fangiana]|uniref:Uncharacterized protein n=1 Tax=Carpinus fangiana TaxID=176857 RepID=A0A5N6KW73_9ROSI|nr:hypothetical protein FH972_023577 [Carpinus fangiana]
MDQRALGQAQQVRELGLGRAVAREVGHVEERRDARLGVAAGGAGDAVADQDLRMGDSDRPRDRDRSRSPRRDKKPKISGGFKWKEKKPARDDGEGNAQETRSGRVGGYRDRDDDRPRRRKDREEDEDQAHSRDKERRRDREQDRSRRSPLPSAPEEAPQDPAAKEKKQDAPAIDNDILSNHEAKQQQQCWRNIILN